MFRLPKKEDILNQGSVVFKDLPARSGSVLSVIGMSAFYLPLSLVAAIATLYIITEVFAIFVVKAIQRRITWLRYLALLFAASAGASLFLIIPYQMWQLDSQIPRFFSLCALISCMIHCATVRSYHLPLAGVTLFPVLVTIVLTLVTSILEEEGLRDRIVGLVILSLMVGYVLMIMIEESRSRSFLARARKEADDANIAKGRFLAMMSHEIRTPLNGILGMAQVISEGVRTKEEKERADTLLSSAEMLKAMVDDVLDHTKIEEGELALKLVPANLLSVVDSVVKLFGANAADKGLYINVVVEDDFPEILLIDPIRLRQVIMNLISNAIKFTDRGGITVKIKTQGANGVKISIIDTGIGISQEGQAKLFGRYSQVDQEHERAAQGTGLGLSISHGLVNLMDGSMSVTSAPGSGSEFSFVFKAERPSKKECSHVADVTEDAAPGWAGKSVLVVDDSQSNRVVARAFLESLGFVVTEASNGKEAVEAVRMSGFHLILLDIQMPVLDGQAAFRQMKREGLAKSLIVIALTGENLESATEKYLFEGMQGCLQKPLEKSQLEKMLAEVFDLKSAA